MMDYKSMATQMKINMKFIIRISYLEDLKPVEMYLVIHKSEDMLYSLDFIHRHVEQSMCCGTYLVQVHVDLDMSWLVK